MKKYPITTYNLQKVADHHTFPAKVADHHTQPPKSAWSPEITLKSGWSTHTTLIVSDYYIIVRLITSDPRRWLIITYDQNMANDQITVKTQLITTYTSQSGLTPHPVIKMWLITMFHCQNVAYKVAHHHRGKVADADTIYSHQKVADHHI